MMSSVNRANSPSGSAEGAPVLDAGGASPAWRQSLQQSGSRHRSCKETLP